MVLNHSEYSAVCCQGMELKQQLQFGCHILTSLTVDLTFSQYSKFFVLNLIIWSENALGLWSGNGILAVMTLTFEQLT